MYATYLFDGKVLCWLYVVRSISKIDLGSGCYKI